MKYENNKVSEIKLAYIGGGSRGWAWGFMSDLVSADDISGEVRLYDIDKDAAKRNEIIGNKYNNAEGAKSHWDYVVKDSLKDALTGADFVIISILPATFDEMESDVHTPEKYGIYQSVGDTVGAGGIVRALRTMPMYEEIGLAIKDYCPKAWVINYTNPMTVCVRTLYRVFPEIKAFGCCHEVFGTQKFLVKALEKIKGIKAEKRADMKVNVVGVNHFTWITEAKYKNIDMFEVYKEFVDKYADEGFLEKVDDNWMNNGFATSEMVKMDLFKRYGYIAAAGDRHLAEFCPGRWYLKDRETVEKRWKFGLTSVKWRKKDLADRYKRSDDLISGKERVKLNNTGEDGVNQIRALLGLQELTTNVNIPNKGQIPNLPLGAVVETNAVFRADEVTPVFAGDIPMPIYALITRIVGEQEEVVKAGAEKNLTRAFNAFLNDPQLSYIGFDDAKKLWDEMIKNTEKYLTMYKK